MSSELQNIPSIWTVVSHWMACCLYLSFLPKRFVRWQRVAGMGAFFGVLCLYHSLIWDWDDGLFNLAMFGFAVLTILPLVALARTHWTAQLYYGARAFILGGFAVSLSWQLYLYYAQRMPLLAGLAGQVIFMLGACLVIHGFLYLLERSRKQDIHDMQITPAAAASTVLIAFIIYILSSISFSSIETPFGGETDAQAFNIRSLVYLGGVAILYAMHLQLCDVHIRQEVDALQGMLNMQYSNYRLSQESVELINRKYHDLKHQIGVLRSELGTAQKLECLDQMEQEIHAYEALSQTGNKVLDTILTSKSIYCQNHGIQLTCVVDGHALDFMGVVDLSSLFGNALDNAIEAVESIPNAEQRLIHLSVARQKGFLRIRLENRCSEDLVVGGAFPRTTKSDPRFHGYGLKSIRAIAEKYGGSTTVQAAGGWFELRILIPTDPVL